MQKHDIQFSITNKRHKRSPDLHELINHIPPRSYRARRKAQLSKDYHDEHSITLNKPKKFKKRSSKHNHANKYILHDDNHKNTKPINRKENKKKHKKKRITISGESRRNRYSKEESKRIEKYSNILGSGNFEIIRGGILDKTDEEKAYKVKSESDQAKNRKINKKDRPNEGDEDGDSRLGGGDGVEMGDDDQTTVKPDIGEENGDNDNFEPFNFDVFNTDPILGFQGYDNFDASQNDFRLVNG